MVRQAWPLLLFFAVVACAVVYAVVSHAAAGRRRRIAVNEISAKYSLRDTRFMGWLYGLPQLEGTVQGRHVRVIFWANQRFKATSFFFQVRVPALGYAVVEPRAEVGGKGPIGALVERHYVGTEEIYLDHPQMLQTFRVRGKEPVELRALLHNPGVAQALLQLHAKIPNASIEWGLLRFYRKRLMDDATQLGRLIEQGIAVSAQLEHASATLAAPSGPGHAQ